MKRAKAIKTQKSGSRRKYLRKKNKRRRALKNSKLKAYNILKMRLSEISEVKTVQKNHSRNGSCFWANYFNVLKWKDYCRTEPVLSSVSAVKYARFNAATSRLQSPNVLSKPIPLSSKYSTTEIFIEENELLDTDSEESSDIVVSHEFMKFLEENMQHKASLKAEKEAAATESEKADATEDGNSCDRDNIEDCKVPTANEGEIKRTEEMELLYGKSSPMIHGMETAVQLSFNRNCDKLQPSYWPVHSFNFVFTNHLQVK